MKVIFRFMNKFSFTDLLSVSLEFIWNLYGCSIDLLVMDCAADKLFSLIEIAEK
jgi:hypothetical protein